MGVRFTLVGNAFFLYLHTFMMTSLCRTSHQKLSDELDVLCTLSSASIELHQLQQLYSDLVTLKSRLDLELEALSKRAVCV